MNLALWLERAGKSHPDYPAVATGERAGIFVATAVFMVAILVALVISYALTRRLPVMAIVSAENGSLAFAAVVT